MGILLVYDVTSKKTFENITNWLKNIEEHAAEGVEQLLVANKVFIADLCLKKIQKLWFKKCEIK